MPKINFLFWNVAKRNVGKQIENLVVKHHIDILILAEFNLQEGEEKISGTMPEGFKAVPDSNNKIKIFSKMPSDEFLPISNEERYTVRLLNFKGCEEILLVALHFPSKLNLTNDEQNTEAVILNMNLAQIEKDYGIENTVVVGDFNMHPFDYGMVSHAGFNSVMTKKIAKKGKRQVHFRDYPYFYNPMWGFLGDLNDKMPGTHYYQDDYHWHLYDQLLIRPSLINNFDPDELEIIVSDGESQFLSKNGSIRKSFSDHLPLKFSLNL